MKNIKVYAMAQYCSLDHSTLYKMIRGKRKPPSSAIVETLPEFMHLTPGEYKKFLEAYKISLIGCDNYYQRKTKLFRVRFPMLSI